MHVAYLLRHAKSSWEDSGIPDDERPLAPRGRRAAAAIARHLEGQGIEPALVLCSSARRTLETLKPLRKVFSAKVEVSVEPGLYGASAQDLLHRLRAVPSPVPSVMVVGHNPGLQDLGLLLARPSAQRRALEAKFPTGALAVLRLDVVGWPDLAAGTAELASITVPRELG